MQPFWRKQLYKTADVVINLPPGHPAWLLKMFEPLTIAFIFLFTRFIPWQLRGSIHILALGRELSRVWRDNCPGEGPLLRQLWSVQKRVSNLSEELACSLLQSKQLDHFPYSNARKRRGAELVKNKGRIQVQKRKAWRHDKFTFSVQLLLVCEY